MDTIDQFLTGWWAEIKHSAKRQLIKYLELPSSDGLLPFDMLSIESATKIKKFFLSQNQSLVCYLIGEGWL